MQQTEKYKLNLIETSDTFSPHPLNENAQKLETQLSAETAARTAGEAALDQRVTTLEGHKISAGTYRGNAPSGNNVWQSIPLGFTPIFVYIQTIGGSVPTSVASGGRHNYLLIEEGGFKAKNSLNQDSSIYNFFAIL